MVYRVISSQHLENKHKQKMVACIFMTRNKKVLIFELHCLKLKCMVVEITHYY